MFSPTSSYTLPTMRGTLIPSLASRHASNGSMLGTGTFNEEPTTYLKVTVEDSLNAIGDFTTQEHY